MKQPSIAFAHDWLIDRGGAENVLDTMLEIWPEAPIFTIVSDSNGQCSSIIRGRIVNNSFIAKLPFAKKIYRNYLPFMPLAVEQLDLRGYDMVISSSYAVAKGVITAPDQLHIAYVHSPIRYAWDLQHQYLEEAGLTHGIKSLMARVMLYGVRNWDYRTANGVDFFLSNSDFIGRRIRKVYRRESVTVYPPVDVDKFIPGNHKEDYYLTASRMVPYKKIDIIVDAFAEMPERKLIVIGDGPDFEKIKKKARANVHLLGYQPFEVLIEHMQRARAFVFAAEEDFGIVPVEAQACGTPVIAYGKGGVLETVIGGETGLFFEQQTAKSIVEAAQRFEGQETKYDPRYITQNAARFSKQRFQHEIKTFVEEKWFEFSSQIKRSAKRPS